MLRAAQGLSYEEPIFRLLLFLISPFHPIKHTVVIRPVRARLHRRIPQSFFRPVSIRSRPW